MKNKKWLITLIIILTIIMLVLSIFFVSLFQSNFKFNGFRFRIGLQNSKELVLDKTYEEKFNNIIIDASTSEVFIKKSVSEKVKTIIYGEQDYTDVETNLDTLNIKISEKNCIGFCFNQTLAKIEIYLPEEFNGDIEIKNDYGDISIAEFLNANIDIVENCGDVKILGGNIVNVDNDYGNIEIARAKVSNINADCGDVVISNIDDVTVKNSYGDIKIKSVDNYLYLENDCGDIELNNINLKKNSYIKDDYGDIRIGNTNELFIDAKTDLGKIKIKNNYNKSALTLKIENDCGDIEVTN